MTHKHLSRPKKQCMADSKLENMINKSRELAGKGMVDDILGH